MKNERLVKNALALAITGALIYGSPVYAEHVEEEDYWEVECTPANTYSKGTIRCGGSGGGSGGAGNGNSSNTNGNSGSSNGQGASTSEGNQGRGEDGGN